MPKQYTQNTFYRQQQMTTTEYKARNKGLAHI